MTNTIYMYLLGMVILFFAGNIIQWIYFKDLSDKEKKEKEEKEKKEKALKDEEKALIGK